MSFRIVRPFRHPSSGGPVKGASQLLRRTRYYTGTISPAATSGDQQDDFAITSVDTTKSIVVLNTAISYIWSANTGAYGFFNLQLQAANNVRVHYYCDQTMDTDNISVEFAVVEFNRPAYVEHISQSTSASFSDVPLARSAKSQSRSLIVFPGAAFGSHTTERHIQWKWKTGSVDTLQAETDSIANSYAQLLTW